jgi:hypothetical protein
LDQGIYLITMAARLIGELLDIELLPLVVGIAVTQASAALAIPKPLPGAHFFLEEGPDCSLDRHRGG